MGRWMGWLYVYDVWAIDKKALAVDGLLGGHGQGVRALQCGVRGTREVPRVRPWNGANCLGPQGTTFRAS